MNRQASQQRRERAEGFTLLEVMVAATLMGLVLVIILQVLTSTLQAQEASRSNTQAVMTAQMVLEEFGAREVAEGVFQGKVGRFSYQVDVKPQFQVPYPGQNKRLVCSSLQVTLSWEERGRTKILELLTLRTTVQK
ncbi:MAG: type IV pilus modification PilV family protein [Thermodesulfobacteriota bacterium]